MAKVTNVNDARVKARRTSLKKKGIDDLVNIILRKDDVERRNQESIKKLNRLLNEADELNEDKVQKIDALEKERDSLNQDVIDNKRKVIDLTQTQHYLESEIARLKDVCNFRRTTILVEFGIIVVLGVLLIF